MSFTKADIDNAGNLSERATTSSSLETGGWGGGWFTKTRKGAWLCVGVSFRPDGQSQGGRGEESERRGGGQGGLI